MYNLRNPQRLLISQIISWMLSLCHFLFRQFRQGSGATIICCHCPLPLYSVRSQGSTHSNIPHWKHQPCSPRVHPDVLLRVLTDANFQTGVFHCNALDPGPEGWAGGLRRRGPAGPAPTHLSLAPKLRVHEHTGQGGVAYNQKTVHPQL